MRESSKNMAVFGQLIKLLYNSRAAQFIFITAATITIYLFYNSGHRRTFSEDSRKLYANEVFEKRPDILVDTSNFKFDSPAVKGEIMQTEERDGIAAVVDRNDVLDEISIVITFVNAKRNVNLQKKFTVCVESLLKHATVSIVFYIIGDAASQIIAANILQSFTDRYSKYRIVNLNMDELAEKLHGIVQHMQELFSFKPGSLYSHALFFLSMAMHKLMPTSMRHVIMLDADLKFRTDVKELFELFSEFDNTNIIGIAPEMQPVYRHTFHSYRRKHHGTRVGEPLPDGLPGFNSGVLLLSLERMRKSQLYNSFLDAEKVKALAQKYEFKGHLGDQDFFTLLSMENEKLFYYLPCSWNRQLCTWWRDKGYESVFDMYHDCAGPINVYHGNCNTPIPA